MANVVVCLIHQANYLLDQQIRQLEQAFLKEGGLRERMSKARRQVRRDGWLIADGKLKEYVV
ncbi:MAG: four helix bundle suffix domain-containing protein [Planctomycetaceae bacterium]